ncbi:MAG: hypothetical protein IK048_03850 [Clostridia bacterium]|nr:hypothetical protein [Clostridia bacterium]
MRFKDKVSARIRDMLTNDKLGLSDGFMTAFQADVTHLVKDYFDVSGQIDVKIFENEDGKYGIKISALADKINTFETTFKKKF